MSDTIVEMVGVFRLVAFGSVCVKCSCHRPMLECLVSNSKERRRKKKLSNFQINFQVSNKVYHLICWCPSQRIEKKRYLITCRLRKRKEANFWGEWKKQQQQKPWKKTIPSSLCLIYIEKRYSLCKHNRNALWLNP